MSFDPSLAQDHVTSEENAFFYLFNTPVSSFGRLMRLDRYRELNLAFKLELRPCCEDIEWFFNSFSKFSSFSYINYVGIYRLVHSNSASHNKSADVMYVLFTAIQSIYNSFVKEMHWNRVIRHKFISLSMNIFTFRIKYLGDMHRLPEIVMDFKKCLESCEYVFDERESKIIPHKTKGKCELNFYHKVDPNDQTVVKLAPLYSFIFRYWQQ